MFGRDREFVFLQARREDRPPPAGVPALGTRRPPPAMRREGLSSLRSDPSAVAGEAVLTSMHIFDLKNMFWSKSWIFPNQLACMGPM